MEAKVAQEGYLLTEAQLQALEKVQDKREAQDEIEMQHPGYLGSQDTYLRRSQLKRWVKFISRPLLIPIPESPLPRFIPRKMPWLQPIY